VYHWIRIGVRCLGNVFTLYHVCFYFIALVIKCMIALYSFEIKVYKFVSYF